MLICGNPAEMEVMERVISSDHCTDLKVRWRAVGNRIKRYWCAKVLCVCVYRGTLLTAMADLMAWSWKKTLPPSSGHTVLISSLLIPRSSLPVSTPRLFTVLQHEVAQNKFNMHYKSYLHHGVPTSSVCIITHILEKPLYSSQAFTCAEVEFMSRLSEARLSRCEGEWRGRNATC